MTHSATTALVMIDIQNDFCPGGALAVSGGDQIIARVNNMQDDFKVRVLTQDWHPEGHSSFAASHDGAAPFSMTDMPYGPQVLWPTHCVQNSDGAAFHPKLRADADLIVRKGYNPMIDSYSAFYENDHATPTGLHGYLQERGIKSLVMVGLATDFCVRFSAVDAAKLGYDVTVDLEACRAIDMDGSLTAAVAEMRENGVDLIGA